MADRLSFQAHGREVLTLEAKAVAELADRIDERFAQACELILQCTRRKARALRRSSYTLAKPATVTSA